MSPRHHPRYWTRTSEHKAIKKGATWTMSGRLSREAESFGKQTTLLSSQDPFPPHAQGTDSSSHAHPMANQRLQQHECTNSTRTQPGQTSRAALSPSDENNTTSGNPVHLLNKSRVKGGKRNKNHNYTDLLFMLPVWVMVSMYINYH